MSYSSGGLIQDGRKRGHTFSHPDVLIAATAAHQDATVVTRNVDEFEAAGVAVFNPGNGKDSSGTVARSNLACMKDVKRHED